MIKYILGVDGGATKTHCALFTVDGVAVDFLQWGSTNHEVLKGGFSEMRTTLGKMLEKIRFRNDLKWEETRAFFGLAGIDTVSQEKMTLHILNQEGLTGSRVFNDALLGIYACTDNNMGICALNGTGTGVFGIDSIGDFYHCGGLYGLSGDYAGGKILGEEAVRSVYDMLYRDGPKTCLCRLLAEKLDVSDKKAIFETLMGKITEGVAVSQDFAPLLFEASDLGDAVAGSILRKSGEVCANDVYHVVKHLNFSKDKLIPLILVGSLYTKPRCQVQIDSMREALRRMCPDFCFDIIKMTLHPITGAVRFGLGLYGKKMDACKIEKSLLALGR